MRATLLKLSDTVAVVRLDPNWLGRLFGARPTACAISLVRESWVYAYTSRALSRGDSRDRAVLEVLEHTPCEDIPVACAREMLPAK